MAAALQHVFSVGKFGAHGYETWGGDNETRYARLVYDAPTGVAIARWDAVVGEEEANDPFSHPVYMHNGVGRRLLCVVKDPTSAFQLHAKFRGLEPVHYHLYVDRAEFVRQMNEHGAVVGAPALINAMSDMAGRITLPHELHHHHQHQDAADAAALLTTTGGVLLPHQCRALHAMHELEANIINGDATLQFHSSVALGDTGYVYDTEEEALVPCAQRDGGYGVGVGSLRRVPYHGGVLCGESGTGKTATVLALALSSPPHDTWRLLSAYEASHLTPCDATLVVVPNHLLEHWRLEAERWLPEDACNAVIWLSSGRHRRVTMRQLRAARLVVTTQGFASRFADRAPEEELLPRHSDARGEQRERAAKRRRLYEDDADAVALLSSVLWRRVVVDQPLNSMKTLIVVRPLLRARVWWAMQAGAEHVVREQMYDLLPDITTDARRVCSLTFNIIKRHCFVRHSMLEGEALAINRDTREVIRVLTLPARQSTMMTHIKRESQYGEQGSEVVRFACGIGTSAATHIHSPVTIDEALRIARKKLTNDCKRQKRRVGGVAHAEAARLRYRHMEHRVGVLEAKREEEGDAEDEVCSICFTERYDVITVCGHTFCWSCAYQALNVRPNCPQCRHDLSTRDSVIELLHTQALTQTTAQQQPTTKMEQLLHLLRGELAGERVVVFILWNDLATMVQQQLQSSGICTATLSGNTNSARCALRAFANDTVRVLVVPLSITAGLNFPQVSHAVFYHELPADIVEDSTQDATAVLKRLGRNQEQHITIHRLCVDFPPLPK